MDESYLFNTIIADAYLKGVSDVHFESPASQESCRVLLRMDGVWRAYMTIHSAAADDIIKIIKSKANFDAENSHLPKIGRFKFKHEGLPEFHLAVTTQPSDNLREAATLKIQTA